MFKSFDEKHSDQVSSVKVKRRTFKWKCIDFFAYLKQ